MLDRESVQTKLPVLNVLYLGWNMKTGLNEDFFFDIHSVNVRSKVYSFSSSHVIDKARYGSMVFTNKKHHLNLNCLTTLLIGTSLIDSVTVRFGIGSCTILHSPFWARLGLHSWCHRCSCFLSCEVRWFGKWLWGSFSTVSFVACNILNLIIHTQKFRLYVTPCIYSVVCFHGGTI